MEKSCFCPRCGATHIEGQAHCLACGAALEPGTSTGETKPDGSYLATAGELSDLAVWRVADHSQVFSTFIDDTSDFLTPITGPADLPMICGLGWSKDGKNVLAAYGSGEGTQVIDHWSVG